MAYSALTAAQTNVGSSSGQTLWDKVRLNFDFLYTNDKHVINQGSTSYDQGTTAWIETINATRDIASATESYVWTTYVDIPENVTSLTVRLFGMTEDSNSDKSWEVDIGGQTCSVTAAQSGDDSIKWYDAGTVSGPSTGWQELILSGKNEHGSLAKLFTFHRIAIWGN
ncbi:MAG: hypothetical protein GY847_14260 [Proteobacteria bacterium]|nr:hypothetical protein [Pseudomonadota bacterium]